MSFIYFCSLRLLFVLWGDSADLGSGAASFSFQLDGDKNEMFWKSIEINQTLNINSYVWAMIYSVLHKQ